MSTSHLVNKTYSNQSWVSYKEKFEDRTMWVLNIQLLNKYVLGFYYTAHCTQGLEMVGEKIRSPGSYVLGLKRDYY